MTKPHNLDEFEEAIFKLGYVQVAEIILDEIKDERDYKKIYANVWPFQKIARDLGFQEDTIMRVRFFDNKYYGTFYLPKK